MPRNMNILGRRDCRVVSSSSRGGWSGLLQAVLHYPPAQASPKTATRCHSTVRKSMGCRGQEKGWMVSSGDHGHRWKPGHWCKNWGDKTMATICKTISHTHLDQEVDPGPGAYTEATKDKSQISDIQRRTSGVSPMCPLPHLLCTGRILGT